MTLPREVVEEIEKESEEYDYNCTADPTVKGVRAYKAGATAWAERSEKLAMALKYECSCMGEKDYEGNPIICGACDALDEYRRSCGAK